MQRGLDGRPLYSEFDRDRMPAMQGHRAPVMQVQFMKPELDLIARYARSGNPEDMQNLAELAKGNSPNAGMALVALIEISGPESKALARAIILDHPEKFLAVRICGTHDAMHNDYNFVDFVLEVAGALKEQAQSGQISQTDYRSLSHMILFLERKGYMTQSLPPAQPAPL